MMIKIFKDGVAHYAHNKKRCKIHTDTTSKDFLILRINDYQFFVENQTPKNARFNELANFLLEHINSSTQEIQIKHHTKIKGNRYCTFALDIDIINHKKGSDLCRYIAKSFTF